MIFSPELQTLLATATDKTDWASILNAALGASKRVRFFDSATECRNVAMSNNGVTTGNAGLAMLGAFSDNTVSAASNLAAGNGSVRIEGNGHSVTLTLGLTGSGKQLELGADLDASGGIGNNGIALVPPATLPNASSGSGSGGDISVLQVQFGASGSPQPTVIAEQLYSGMVIGFDGVTQSRWRCNPVIVNGIEYTIMPGLDSNGRADVWIFAEWLANAPGVTVPNNAVSNREFATVELRVSYNSTPQILWDGTESYIFDFQRGCALRWQSEFMPWRVTSAHINSLISSGKVMKHRCNDIFGATKDAGFPENIVYRPFKQYGATNINTTVGDQLRAAGSGGERDSIGLVHEKFARTVAEVGTHNMESFATPGRVATLKNLAETTAQMQFAGGLLSTVDHRLLDPSSLEQGGPYTCISTSPISATQRYVPQAGGGTPGYLNHSWDHSHPQNIISYYAYQLSRDPWHLLQAQSEACAMIMWMTFYGGKRGTAGTTNRIAPGQERALWWGLKILVEAWEVSASTPMPKPFQTKAFFASVIENSVGWLRQRFMDSPTVIWPDQSAMSKAATYFWGCFEALTFSTKAELGAVPYISPSPFQNDYGHIVLCHITRIGYTGLNDLIQFHAKNAKLRAQAGGNWYNTDLALSGSGSIVAPTTGTGLPYTDPAGWKAWHPLKVESGKVDGDITSQKWIIDYPTSGGNYTYIHTGALQCYKHLVESGRITLDWDPAAELTAFINHLIPPHLDKNGNPDTQPVRCKHFFDY